FRPVHHFVVFVRLRVFVIHGCEKDTRPYTWTKHVGNSGLVSWFSSVSCTLSSASCSPGPPLTCVCGGWRHGWSAPRRMRLTLGTNALGCVARLVEQHGTSRWLLPSERSGLLSRQPSIRCRWSRPTNTTASCSSRSLSGQS